MLKNNRSQKNAANSSSVFSNIKKKSTKRRNNGEFIKLFYFEILSCKFSYYFKDPLNQTRLLNSDDVARQTFVDHYGSSSFREANDLGNQKASTVRKHKQVGLD